MIQQQLTILKLSELQQNVLSLLHSTQLTSIEIGHRFNISDATVRTWKRKFYNDYVLTLSDNATMQTFQNQNMITELQKRNVAKRSVETTIETRHETTVETVEETPVETVQKTFNFNWIKLTLISVSMSLISMFQGILTNGSFWQIGEIIGFQSIQKAAFWGALAFVLGGISLAAFGTKDHDGDRDFFAVAVFCLIDAGINSMSLVHFDKGVSICILSILISIATPFVFYWLSRNFFIVLNELIE